MKHGLQMGLVFAVGVALGGAAMAAWGDDPDAAVRPPGARLPPDAAAAAPVAQRAADPVPDAGSGPSSTVERDVAASHDGTVVSPALRAYAAAEIELGWREVRSDPIEPSTVAELVAIFATTVERTPRVLGRRAAEQRSERDRKAAAFAGADLITLLQSIDGKEPEAAEFVQSPRFANALAPRGGGSGVDGTRLSRSEAIPEGAVVSFPVGVHAVGDLGAWRPPATDVTLRGAGMDATLLVLDAQRHRVPLRRLAIEDCTVYCDGAITDLRQVPAVLALRRVRIVGFDCGAGHCVAFYLFGGVALSAVECRFEGGYGRHPEFANLMTVHGPCLARFERCSFERMDLANADRASVVFVDCAMREMLADRPPGPTFANCDYRRLSDPQRRDDAFLRRDLGTLFDDWRNRRGH